MAKVKFSAVEDFYIQGHLDDDPKSVAKALGKARQGKAVAARIEELREQLKASPNTKTEHGKRGVAVMTEAAAAIPAVSEPASAYRERNGSFLHNPNPRAG